MGSRHVLKHGFLFAQGAATRLRAVVDTEPRFAGAFSTRDAALASLPAAERAAYDRDDVADVSLNMMSQIALCDYPVLLWLDRLIRENHTLSLLDAGGHVGTKFLAFSDQLPLSQIDWAVWDLQALLKAGRQWQREGRLPKAIRFVDTPKDAGDVDLLLASGLLQYLDISLTQLLGQMSRSPRYVILNKVATWPNDEMVTLELIGSARVPYRIRNKPAFEVELAEVGYIIRDSWTIASLSHRIGTHPWLGASESMGYFLERA
jgi:putative methyltransferase (TIGR04325 family)